MVELEWVSGSEKGTFVILATVKIFFKCRNRSNGFYWKRIDLRTKKELNFYDMCVFIESQGNMEEQIFCCFCLPGMHSPFL